MPEDYKPAEISGKLRPELKEALGRLNEELATRARMAGEREARERLALQKENERLAAHREFEKSIRDQAKVDRDRENYGASKHTEWEGHGKQEAGRQARAANNNPDASPYEKPVRERRQSQSRGRGRSRRITDDD